eukprot:jgi/Ulvmu1/1355/UM011_0083.1
MLVLYGSQTGNAQDVAEFLASEATERGIDSCALPMDCVSVEEAGQESVVLFVCSTTGQGEVPDGMKHFWTSMLRKSLPASMFADTSFAVFGLGDSGYVQFNVVAKKLDRRLQQLGGIRLIDKGLGDDQATSGYEATLDPWMQELFKSLAVLFTSRGTPKSGTASPRPCRYSVHIGSPEAVDAQRIGETSLFGQACAASAQFQQLAAVAAGVNAAAPLAPVPARAPHVPSSPCLMTPFWATVSASRRLTAADHWQVVQHVEFDISQSGMTYSPGDLLATMPFVPAETGRAFLERIGVATDASITIGVNVPALSRRLRARLSDAAVRHDVTVSALAVACGVLDIAGTPPRRPLFRCLAACAAADAERERLEYFASAEGRDDLAVYCARERRSLLDVLQDFPSATPTLGQLLESAPLLRPRQFSLSSSPLAHPGQAHITVAEVDFRTPFRRRMRGLCSSWLVSLNPGDVAPVWLERGALQLPPPAVPVICVGPGTGLAPFRSFLWERIALLRRGTAVAPSTLFVGCRYHDRDFLYADEWEEMLTAGVLRQHGGLLCAFSRDQPGKRYVQDCVREQQRQLWNMLHHGNASVFVSGSAAKMPVAVADAFVDVIAHGLECTPEQARKLQRQLEAAKRYNVEAWS